MIDPKYTTKALTVLTPEEKYLEVMTKKTTTTIELFDDDLKKAQDLNINISRIIRFKFRDWLQEKIEV